MDGNDDSDGVAVEAVDFLRSNAPRDDDFDDMRDSTVLDGANDDQVPAPVLKKRTDAMTSKMEVWIKILEVLLVTTDDEASGLVLKDVETLLNGLLDNKLRASNKTFSSVWDSRFELCLKNGTVVHTAVSIHETPLQAELEADTQGAARRNKARTGSYVAKAKLASTKQEIEIVFMLIRSLPIDDVSPMLKSIFGQGAVQLSFGHASQSIRVQENRIREQFTAYIKSLCDKVHECKRSEKAYSQRVDGAGAADGGEPRRVGRTRTAELRDEFVAKTTDEAEELRRAGAITTDEDLKQFQMMALLSEPKYAAAYKSVAVATRNDRRWYPELHVDIPPSDACPIAVPPPTLETSDEPMMTADEELDDRLQIVMDTREDVSRALRNIEPNDIQACVREVTTCQRENGYLNTRRGPH